MFQMLFRSFLAAVYIFCNVLPHNWLRRLKPFRSQDRSSIYIFYSKETFYLLPEDIIFIFSLQVPFMFQDKNRVFQVSLKRGHFLWSHFECIAEYCFLLFKSFLNFLTGGATLAQNLKFVIWFPSQLSQFSL